MLDFFLKGLKPAARLSVVEWADTYRYKAPEAGSSSGRWRTSDVEIARGPMLAVTEEGVSTITLMACTQLFKSSVLENVFGYFAHIDPCPIMIVQPKESSAESFSKERITPMIKNTPILRELVGTKTTRNAKETLVFKQFPGGFLVLVGAGSPDNLARRAVRVILFDEVDKYPVTREGDPIALGEERTATFSNSICIRACSPTVTDESRIAALYNESDQRRASVECPLCKHRQFLDFFEHVNWNKVGDGSDRHRPETARVTCESCGKAWTEGHRQKALRTIRWHQTRQYTCCNDTQTPLTLYKGGAKIEDLWEWYENKRTAVYYSICVHCHKRTTSNKHVGFTASKLYSPWKNDEPAEIAAKWLKMKAAQDTKQAWFNTQLGIPFAIGVGKIVEIENLMQRLEDWGADIPDRGGMLTAGVDIQDDRIEAEVVFWGDNEESWQVEYKVIQGGFSNIDTQRQLDEFLKRSWVRSDGKEFKIKFACIDSGGHHTQAIYNFCRPRLSRGIYAIKGESATGGARNPVWISPKIREFKASYRPQMIGVNSAKDEIRTRLALKSTKEGSGYMHFRIGTPENYFKQLLSERSVLHWKAGRQYRAWELPSGRANEALDCRVYAYAALCGYLNKGGNLKKIVLDTGLKK